MGKRWHLRELGKSSRLLVCKLRLSKRANIVSEKKKHFLFTISWRKRTTKDWQSFRTSKWSPSDDLCRLHYCRTCCDLRNSLPGGNWTKIYYVSKQWICSNNFFPGSEESLVGCRERQAVSLKETDVEILEAICFLSIVDNSQVRTENVKVNQAKLNVCIFHCIISQLKLKRPPKGGSQQFISLCLPRHLLLVSWLYTEWKPKQILPLRCTGSCKIWCYLKKYI